MRNCGLKPALGNPLLLCQRLRQSGGIWTTPFAVQFRRRLTLIAGQKKPLPLRQAGSRRVLTPSSYHYLRLHHCRLLRRCFVFLLAFFRVPLPALGLLLGSRRGLSYAAPSEPNSATNFRLGTLVERSSENAQHNQCHVVVLGSACGECLRGGEDSGHRFKGRCSVAGSGKLD